MKKFAGLLVALFALCRLYAAPQTLTILVFPFENRSSSADLGWMSEAFSDVLASRLSGPHRFVLERDERNTAYRQLGIPPNSTLTLASEYQVAQTLGVDWAVVGSFKVTGGRMSAEASLLDMRHLKLYPAVMDSGPLSNLVAIQTKLAWGLLAAHDPHFTVETEQAFAALFPSIGPYALENYIRGLLAADGPTKVHFLTTASQLGLPGHKAAYALGRYYFKQKDYSQSEFWLSKVKPSDSGYLASLFFSGVDDFFLARDKSAEKDFSELSLRMPLGEVWNNLGVLQARRGAYTEALESFRRAYAGDSADPDYEFNLGACYCDLQRYSEAVKYLQKAAGHDEDELSTRTLLAYALNKTGDTNGSAAQLQWVADHDGESMAALNSDILPQPRLKKTYNGAAFRLLAVAVQNSLESELTNQPPEVQGRAYLARGEQFIRERQLPEAVTELQEAASRMPGTAVVHLLLGQAYDLEGRHHKALAQLEMALQLDDNAVTHLWIAHAYLGLHETSQALEHVRSALSLDPGNPDAQRLLDAIEGKAKSTQTDP